MTQRASLHHLPIKADGFWSLPPASPSPEGSCYGRRQPRPEASIWLCACAQNYNWSMAAAWAGRKREGRQAQHPSSVELQAGNLLLGTIFVWCPHLSIWVVTILTIQHDSPEGLLLKFPSGSCCSCRPTCMLQQLLENELEVARYSAPAICFRVGVPVTHPT